jgi:hypothetical protein
MCWDPWSSVSKAPTAHGSPVAALAIEPCRFALFIADLNGGVYTTSRNAGRGWDPW